MNKRRYVNLLSYTSHKLITKGKIQLATLTIALSLVFWFNKGRQTHIANFFPASFPDSISGEHWEAGLFPIFFFWPWAGCLLDCKRKKWTKCRGAGAVFTDFRLQLKDVLKCWKCCRRRKESQGVSDNITNKRKWFVNVAIGMCI